MIIHKCDRCEEIIDPKTGLTTEAREYKDGQTSWKFQVTVNGTRGMHLCRRCLVDVINGVSEVFRPAAPRL